MSDDAAACGLGHMGATTPTWLLKNEGKHGTPSCHVSPN